MAIVSDMAHLRPVSETILARAKRDPEFRASLLAEAIELMAENDIQTAKRMLRDYVLASIGFEELAESVGKKPKSLMGVTAMPPGSSGCLVEGFLFSLDAIFNKVIPFAV